MNAISHQQARTWTQLRLDGSLDETKTFALNVHLQGCAACRAHALHLERLDSELRHAYQEHILAQQPVLSPLLSTDSVIPMIHKRMRLNMKNKQIMKLATTLPVTVLAILAFIVFSWLASTRGRVILPGAGNEPIPTPTSFSWTESHPLISAEQIQSALNDLAQKNVNAFQGSAWVHVVRTDRAQPGMIHSLYSDSWTHYPKDNQSCAESLTFVKDGPEPSANLRQLLIALPDGTAGDLVQLESGMGQVARSKLGSDACRLAPELTPAGQFAIRLEQERTASPEKKVDAKAWHTEQDGQVVFNVSVTFVQPSKANMGITKETRSFSVETGTVLQEDIRTEWEDGSLFGESLQSYKTNFFSELPPNVATQYALLSAELKSYAAGTAPRPSETSLPSFDYTVLAGDTCGGIAAAFGVSVQSIIIVNHLSSSCIISEGQPLKIPYPTATPAPDNEMSTSLDDLPYTEENPLTDGQSILQILSALKQRQIERLSKPGWYVYGLESPNPQNWMSNYYFLTHTLDQSGACEFMSYYIKDGRILPQQLALADGRWGMIDVVGDGKVVMGETGKINWNNGPVTDTCQVQNTETVSFIQNETNTFQDIVDGKTQGTYKAWAEQINGRKIFVLYYEVTGKDLGNVMDPDTRKLEPIEHAQTWLYIDLDWGTVLYETGWQVFLLQNGKTIGSAPAIDKMIQDGYTFYTELPADLQVAYEKSVTDLKAYLKK